MSPAALVTLISVNSKIRKTAGNGRLVAGSGLQFENLPPPPLIGNAWDFPPKTRKEVTCEAKVTTVVGQMFPTMALIFHSHCERKLPVDRARERQAPFI